MSLVNKMRFRIAGELNNDIFSFESRFELRNLDLDDFHEVVFVKSSEDDEII